MKHSLKYLATVLLLLSISGAICLAAETDEKSDADPPAIRTEEDVSSDKSQIDIEPPADSLLDIEPSSWSNVKALWG